NNIKIRDTDPTVYAFDKGLKIEGRNAIMYAVAKGIQIEKKDPIIYAYDKGLIFGSKDPIQFAIDTNLKIDGINAIRYAVENEITIDGRSAVDYKMERYENSKKAVEDVNKLFAAMEEDDKNKREQLWGKIRREELLEKIRRERLSEEIIIKANSKPQAVDVKDSEAGAFNSFKFNSINLKDFEETNKAAAVLKQSMTESVGPKSTKSSTLLSPDSSPRTFKRSNSKRSSNSV
ncbi:MAG: hypothetical protein K9G11_01165, partial [Rickettsiaceae bacterium]|nr:hypothetical protein [Rickettsiaceae bacterium]